MILLPNVTVNVSNSTGVLNKKTWNDNMYLPNKSILIYKEYDRCTYYANYV